MTTLPPDRGHVQTEQRHEASMALDAMDVRSCIDLMADDHRIVPGAVQNARESLGGFIEALVERMRWGGRLIYIGAGTSGRLGVLDASECPPTFQSQPEQVIGIIAGSDEALRRSSEGMEDDPRGADVAFDAIGLNESDAVLGIAAGGTTPYVLGGIATARGRSAMTGLLTCSSTAARPDGCDHFIVLDTGAEVLTGSTRLKAGSATKLALNIITTAAFTQLGKVHSNLMVDLRATNDKLRDRAIRTLVMFAPTMTRSDAAGALDEAGGSLKTAIVMHECSMARADAERLLEQNSGVLRDALET